MAHPHGNGSGKFNMQIDDMGGWIRVSVGATAVAPSKDDIPILLSHALTRWFRNNPHLRLRCVVPIHKSGQTVELHAWYEQHLFPDTTQIS